MILEIIGFNNFTAPVYGVYHFDVNLRLTLTSVASPYSFILRIEGGIIPVFQNAQIIPANYSGDYSINGIEDILLFAGQTVFLTLYQNSGIAQAIGGFSVFNGHRVN